MKTSTWKLLRAGLNASACLTAIPALADQSITDTVKTVTVEAVGYVIKIMEANIYIQLKDLPKAKKLFIQALVANPLNLGAYHDLGKLFLATWEPDFAWECFRIARRINPKHPIMEDIDELEQSLQRDLPDYF